MSAARGSRENRGSRDRTRASFGRRSGSLDEAPDPEVLEAERQKAAAEEAKRQQAAEASRGKRRSMAMQNMAMGGGMSDMLSEMSNELVHGVAEDAPPKKKMEAVMINAKERGMTVPQIFKLFLSAARSEGGEDEVEFSDDALEVELTPTDFGAALKQLGGRLFNVPDSEMAALIEDFDEDKNGTISLIEFRNWCYHIPHLAWKAERLRFEKGETGSGGSSVKSASVRRASMKKGGGDSVQAQKLQANTPINAQVKEVYRGTKLFWHTREKIEIVLSESKPYNSLILSTLNETAKVIGALVFIDLDVASSLIDGDALAKAIEKAVESAERSAKGAKGAAQTRKLDMTERAEIENRVRKEMLANLVLLRLKLVDGQATIQTLGSDPPEVQSNFVMGANPGVPLSDLPQFEVPAAVDFKSGAAVLEEMNAMSSGLKNATAASDRASSQLRAALDAIEKLKALSQGSAKRMIGGSPAKQKLYLAMKRRIVRDEADAMRARCAKSPTYHALLAEQAAKGNTESAELLKSLPAL